MILLGAALGDFQLIKLVALVALARTYVVNLCMFVVDRRTFCHIRSTVRRLN